MSKIKLFCFPYAGGSAGIYAKWKQHLEDFIELRPVELAGRGRRINEALYEDVPAAVHDVLKKIIGEITEPYAFFGHSMGGMIAYELAQEIRRHGFRGPEHIFFSGRRPPQIPEPDNKLYHQMDADTFRKEVINLGGTPPELFEYPELLELYIPLLKNDFKLAETNLYNGTILPLDCSITAFFGKDDELAPGEVEGWKEHTRASYYPHSFEGGHFFIHDEMMAVVRCVNETLRQELAV